MTVIVTIVKESNRIATERTVNVDVDHALPHGMKAHLKGLAGANIKKKKKRKRVKSVTKLTDKPRIPP